MELKDYQIDISDRASKCLTEFKIAYLAMETRTGKTITAFEDIRKYGAKNVLFVTKLKAIKSIESDYVHYQQWFKLTVINYESVTKCIGLYDLVVIDEAHACFLGNVLINGVKIKDIKLGDIQKCFNFATQKIEDRKVLLGNPRIPSSVSRARRVLNSTTWPSILVSTTGLSG